MENLTPEQIELTRKNLFNQEKKQEPNRLLSRTELEEELKNYKQILNESTIYDLMSLLCFSFSIANWEKMDAYSKMLSQLDIYNKIGIYNINYKLISAVENAYANVKIVERDNTITFYNNHDNYKNMLAYFDYSKPHKIGEVGLYRYILDNNVVNQEIERIENKISDLKSYIKDFESISYTDYTNITREIRVLENQLKNLKQPLDINQTIDIGITNCVYGSAMINYGLEGKEFEEEKLSVIPFEKDNSLLEKRLIKKLPNLDIVTNIKYRRED